MDKYRRAFIKTLAAVSALFVVKPKAFADGTITTPTNISPTTWGIAQVQEIAGLAGDVAGIFITIYNFDAGGVKRSTDFVTLTGAEVVTYFTTINSPVAGESGSQIKRHRMRVTKVLTDLGKVTNVTPEA
jgi:hypothetical protein